MPRQVEIIQDPTGVLKKTYYFSSPILVGKVTIKIYTTPHFPLIFKCNSIENVRFTKHINRVVAKSIGVTNNHCSY